MRMRLSTVALIPIMVLAATAPRADGPPAATNATGAFEQLKSRYAPGAGNDVAFAFVGGTGFDPAVDRHARDVSFTFKDADHVETSWRFFGEGREETRAKSFLTRQKT